MMLGGRTAVDQMAAALQQMEALGFNPDQVLQAVGRQQYLNQAMGDDPQSALALAPFVGVNPNANTALSATDQNRISARNADESLNQSLQTQELRNQGSLDVEQMRQDGLASRGGRTGSPSSVPNILPKMANDMRQEIESRLKDFNYNTIEPQAVDELLGVATRLFQDPDSGVFKNSAGAVQEAMDRLEMGQLDTLREQTNLTQGISRFVPFTGVPLSGRTTNLTRVPPGQRGAASAIEDPTIAAARTAIAQGAPRDAVLKRLRDNGITPPKDL
jgi:hypothetical protein